MLCLYRSKMFLLLAEVEVWKEFFSEEILNFWKPLNKMLL